MANNKKLEISGLDFDTVKTNLKTFLRNQDQFLDYDFEGSGMSALLDVLAYNTHYLGFHANMLANEMFIDSAALRSSVVSHAKTLGYETRSVRAPRSKVNVTLNDATLATATMNAGQVFTTTINNVSYQFVTVSDFTASQTGAGITFSDIPIYEGSYVTTRYTADSTDVNQKFLLNTDKADTTTLTVQVQNSSSDSTTVTYTKATDITQLTGDSTVYYLQEVSDGQFEVYFGDGVVSKKLSDGNIVILKCVVTNIDEANGAFAFTNSGAINTVVDVTTTTLEIASGGAAAETIQSIKLSAPLDYASQGRCVTTNDYKVFVQKLYPNATANQVFGGENGSFDSSLGVVSTAEYGKVFISVRNNLGTNLTEVEKTGLVSQLGKFTVASITPVIVDPDFMYVLLTCDFKYDSSATTKTKDTLVTEVTQTIIDYNTIELVKFDAILRHSKLLSLIDSTDNSITSSSVNPRLAKYFTPEKGESKSYNLYYNNALYNPHAGHNSDRGGIITSKGFNVSGTNSDGTPFNSGFFGSVRDLGNRIGQGLAIEVVDLYVGTGVWATNLLGSFMKGATGMGSYSDSDQVYDRYDQLNAMYKNYVSDASFVAVADDLEGSAFSSYKHSMQTIGNMLPFTLALIGSMRKGNFSNTQAMYKQLSKKGFSKRKLEVFKTTELGFRLTAIDQYKEAKDLGLNDDQALGYSTFTGLAIGLSNSVFSGEFGVSKQQAVREICKKVAGNLKQAATKQAINKTIKEVTVNLF